MTRQTTEKDRLRIRTLFFEAGFTKAKIRSHTGFTIGQIRTAIRSEKVKDRSGRPPTFTKEEEEELINFVTSSQQARRMSHLKLSTTLFNGKHGQYAIRSTLRRVSKGIAARSRAGNLAVKGDEAGSASASASKPSEADAIAHANAPATGTSSPVAEDTSRRMAIEGLVEEDPAVAAVAELAVFVQTADTVGLAGSASTDVTPATTTESVEGAIESIKASAAA